MNDELKLKRILLATDFNARSDAAETFAVELAAKFNAALFLVSVIEPIMGLEKDDVDAEEFAQFYRKLMGRAETELERRLERWASHRLVVRHHVAVGPRWKVILEQATEHDVNLLVLGRRPYDVSTPLGTTSHKVFVGARCPVLLVPPAPAHS